MGPRPLCVRRSAGPDTLSRSAPANVLHKPRLAASSNVVKRMLQSITNRRYPPKTCVFIDSDKPLKKNLRELDDFSYFLRANKQIRGSPRLTRQPNPRQRPQDGRSGFSRTGVLLRYALVRLQLSRRATIDCLGVARRGVPFPGNPGGGSRPGLPQKKHYAPSA